MCVAAAVVAPPGGPIAVQQNNNNSNQSNSQQNSVPAVAPNAASNAYAAFDAAAFNAAPNVYSNMAPVQKQKPSSYQQFRSRTPPKGASNAAAASAAAAEERKKAKEKEAAALAALMAANGGKDSGTLHPFAPYLSNLQLILNRPDESKQASASKKGKQNAGDSTHVLFVLDESGSMRHVYHSQVCRQSADTR